MREKHVRFVVGTWPAARANGVSCSHRRPHVFALLREDVAPHLGVVCYLLGTCANCLRRPARLSFRSSDRGYNHSHPRADNVFYALEADTGTDAWEVPTKDRTKGRHNSLARERRRTRSRISSLSLSARFLKGATPPSALAAPQALLLNDQTEQGIRTYNFASLRHSEVPSSRSMVMRAAK
jgi:hypothetical protein